MFKRYKVLRLKEILWNKINLAEYRKLIIKMEKVLCLENNITKRVAGIISKNNFNIYKIQEAKNPKTMNKSQIKKLKALKISNKGRTFVKK